MALAADFEQRVFAELSALQPRRPGASQDETLSFSQAHVAPDGTLQAQLEYVFDHDYASQYDRTERTRATVHVAADGRVRLDGWTPPK